MVYNMQIVWGQSSRTVGWVLDLKRAKAEFYLEHFVWSPEHFSNDSLVQSQE